VRAGGSNGPASPPRATQILSQRLRLQLQRGQALGLGLLTVGLVALVVASPLHSLALLLVGAVSAGAGHGFGFLSAQDELNVIAPAKRRGEVTSAFIGCIYLVVATSVIATGVLDRRLSLSLAVGLVGLALAAVAVATAVWQLRAGGNPLLGRARPCSRRNAAPTGQCREPRPD
jgi:hypothetical protein